MLNGLEEKMETKAQSAADLGQHARMLENILQNAAEGICVCHNIPDAPYVRFTHWNPQMVAITGYTMDDINRLGWYQTMYPDPEVQKRAIERMARMRTGDDIQAEEWTITRKDGAKRCLSISTSIVTEEDGKVHVMAIMHDISDRKQAEEELRSNQALLEGVLNGLRDVVGIQLPDHAMIRYNKAGYDLLGLSPGEVTGRKCYELIGRTKPCDICATRTAVQTKQIQTIEHFVSELGRHFLCTSNPILRPDGEIEVIVEQLTDITDRVKADQALRESEEKYRFLAENMSDMVWIIGPDLRTTYVSPSIEKVLGFTPEERNQQSIEEAVTPESLREIQKRLAEELQRDSERGVDLDRSMIIEVEYHRKDGSTLWMENRVQAIRDSENNITGMFGVSRDITERKRAEEELRKSEAFVQDVIRSMRDGVFVLNDRFQYVVWNPAMEAISEVLKEKVLLQEKRPWELFPHLKKEGIHQIMKRIAAGEVILNQEIPYHLPSGKRGFTSASYFPLCAPDGRVTGVIGVIREITEEKRIRDALKESEERLALAIKGTDAGLWDWHVQTGQTVFNERWAEIVGYTLEELAPISIQTWIDLCHPEDLKESNRQLERHFAGETDLYQCECRMKHKDGSWMWVQDRGKVMAWGQDGKPVRITGTHVDITERKHREAVIQAENDMAAAWSKATSLKERLEICLKAAIEVSSMDGGGLYVLDESEGNLDLAVHQGLSETFVRKVSRYSKDSGNMRLVRQGAPAYFRVEDLPEARREVLLSEGVKGLAVVPLVFEGRAVGCLNVASRSMDHMPEHACTALERIARYASSFVAQEMQEEKTRQSQRDLDTLFHTIQDMLVILDGEGNIIHHNSMVTEKLGYPAEHLTGKPVLFIHPEDRHEEARAVIASLLAGEADTCPIPLKTRDGRLIPVETKVVRGHWKGRNVIIGICRDISDRLELEHRTRQVEKAESLDRMAGAIAHHFNNQLQSVMGYLELAMRDLSQGVGPVASMTEAMNAAHRAARVSGQMLTYLGQTPSRHTPMDLSETCGLGLPLIAAAMPKSVVLDTDLPVTGPALRGDANQIHEVMTHLLTNAWESIGEGGGTIHLTVKTVAVEDIPAKRRFPIGWQPKEKRYACLEVRDSGPGIAEQDTEKLFDPFFSTKFTGRGMGLPVVLGIVKAHGGCIVVESHSGKRNAESGARNGRNRGQASEVRGQDKGRPDSPVPLREKPEGSVFWVFLPLCEEALPRPAEEGAKAPALKGGGTVLVIDDEPQLLKLAARMITLLGFEVLTAKDGMEGVEVFREHQDQIRLVLSDLTMPRMDGWATLVALRKIRPDVPVILASGYDEASVMSGDHPEWPQMFLGKPYSLEDLREAIEKVQKAIDSEK